MFKVLRSALSALFARFDDDNDTARAFDDDETSRVDWTRYLRASDVVAFFRDGNTVTNLSLLRVSRRWRKRLEVLREVYCRGLWTVAHLSHRREDWEAAGINDPELALSLERLGIVPYDCRAPIPELVRDRFLLRGRTLDTCTIGDALEDGELNVEDLQEFGLLPREGASRDSMTITLPSPEAVPPGSRLTIILNDQPATELHEPERGDDEAA